MDKVLGVIVGVVLMFLVLSTGAITNLLASHPTPTLLQQQAVPTPVSPTEVRVVSADAVIQSIRSHVKLQTTTYQGAAQVTEARQGSLFGLVNGEQVTLTAVGAVVAGVDLEQLGPDAVQVQGSSVIVHLGAPQIFSVTLDEDSTYVSEHSLSWLSHADPALAEVARREAVKQIRTKACEAHLVDKTERDGSLAIGTIIKQFEFTSAQIYVDSGKGMCS